jgi:diguanylate cyclase (GGDEF)-like protein
MMLESIGALVLAAFAFSAVAWRAQAQAHAHRALVAQLQDREAFVLSAVRSLVSASRVSSHAVMESLHDLVRRHDPAVDAFLAFAPAGDELACVYAGGERVDHYSHLRLRRDCTELLPARAACSGHRAAGGEGLMIPTDRRALAVPMCDENGLHAVVYVSSADSCALAGEDALVRAIEHAASPYALAIEREADRADATYDGLTGLLTPRAFRARLIEEIGRLRLSRTEKVLTLWFIDTDHFKTVNDTYGHGTGDAVLQAMAELIRAAAIPDVDVTARNGGDEFCAIIHDAEDDRDRARTGALRCRSSARLRHSAADHGEHRCGVVPIRRPRFKRTARDRRRRDVPQQAHRARPRVLLRERHRLFHVPINRVYSSQRGRAQHPPS